MISRKLTQEGESDEHVAKNLEGSAKQDDSAELSLKGTHSEETVELDTAA